MVVSADSTILYRHMLLKKGVEVKLIKKEFLYSLVELSNGQKGYVANDALALAPSLPERPSATVSIKPRRKVVSRVKKNSSVASSSTNTSEALPKPSFRY